MYRTKKDLGFVQGSFFVARKYDEKYKKYRLNTVTVRSVSEKNKNIAYNNNYRKYLQKNCGRVSQVILSK